MFPILGLILICEMDITHARTSALNQDCQIVYLYDLSCSRYRKNVYMTLEFLKICFKSFPSLHTHAICKVYLIINSLALVF